MAKKDDDGNQHANLITIGLQMAVGVGLGIVVGGFLDRRYGWQPWGTLVCVMLGLAAGMYLLIKEGIRANKD